MKNWYRVEIDDAGRVVSVTLQSKAGESTRSVVYVEAKGQDAAGKLAEKLYSRRKVKERRAKYRAEGKCNCGRPREDEEFLSCRVCRSNHQGTLERARMGLNRPNGTAIRLEKSATRSRDRRAELRHEVLLELEAKLATFSSVAAARLWVRQEIRNLKGLPDLKPMPMGAKR
jgi:hypothetical protein